ncbi:MAG: arylsulfatase [Victivallales bacterium]|nr:arylsulfatase [Victivallales bacterium]
MPTESRRPNVLLVLTDDQGWGDLRCHGNDLIDTPNLDRFSREGARFDRFFVCPLCAPTRASILTGRYHLRTGVSGVTQGREIIREDEVTVAHAFLGAGYATGCFGKWHSGEHYPHHPNGKGFQEFLGFCAGHWNNYFDTNLQHNGEPVATKGYISDVLTDAAMDFIRTNQDTPFFCYLPFNAPHGPFQVPDEYFDKYQARGLNDKDACIYAMCENVDDNVQRLLDLLDELQLAEDTIVIFLTDNGPNGQRYNGGMRGAKGSVHEGGVRVPCFIRWPGQIAPDTFITELGAHIDFFPTLVDLCGIAMPETKPLDGVSLKPLLLGETTDWPERAIFTHRLAGVQMNPAAGSLRTPRHRLTLENPSRGYELFNLIDDPAETTDIAEREPQILAQLAAEYERIYAQATAAGFERPPIPVGCPEFPRVEIPAPLVTMGGGLEFKGGKGWANDWITNWTTPEDTASWGLHVVHPGSYRVTLMYTCPAEDVGSRIRVTVGAAVAETVLTEAHDPDPLPSPDRVPRMEMYEKVWSPLAFPPLELAAGDQDLVLRALDIPGGQAMDLKAVILRPCNKDRA